MDKQQKHHTSKSSEVSHRDGVLMEMQGRCSQLLDGVEISPVMLEGVLKILAHIRNNSLHTISPEISGYQRQRICRKISALCGEFTRQSPGKKGDVIVYDSYLTEEEWKRFFDWVSGKTLH